MIDTFFWCSPQLKPGLWKSEIVGIRVLKGDQVAVCGVRCIDLSNVTIKILGIHFSYNEKLKEQKDYNCNRYLTSIKIMENEKPYNKGKIAICKTIPISKFVFQSFIKHIINEPDKMQKDFLRKNSTPKIKHETLCNDFMAC